MRVPTEAGVKPRTVLLNVSTGPKVPSARDYHSLSPPLQIPRPVTVVRGTCFALCHRQREDAMGPLASVVGCVLIIVGLLGSMISLRRDGQRF
jgi:hypothetical protein